MLRAWDHCGQSEGFVYCQGEFRDRIWGTGGSGPPELHLPSGWLRVRIESGLGLTWDITYRLQGLMGKESLESGV